MMVEEDFGEFVQVPNCKYPITYTMTIAEVKKGNVPSLGSLIEGSGPNPPISLLNSESR